MNNKNFLNIIKEEIKNFDFLGNDEFLVEQEVNDLLMNEELQKQFICDALLGRQDKVKISKLVDSFITGNWDENNTNDADRISLEYSIEMTYRYDVEQEPINFSLIFSSDRIDVRVDGWNDSGNWGGTMGDAIEPSGDAWFNSFDWNDINVNLFTIDGEEVRFTAFENAPQKIQTLFIREFTQNFIENETMKVKTREMKDNIRNTPYC